MYTRQTVNDMIKTRARAAVLRQRAQLELLESAEIFKSTVQAKLNGTASGPQWENFLRCGNEEIWCTCAHCHRSEKFFYNCNLRWCPLCAHRLSMRRSQVVKLWSSRITQPKHLVLTMRNFPILTRKHVKKFSTALTALRRHKTWKAVRGGCASVEVTNEGQGWHLHAHILLDTDFLDIRTTSIQWGKLIGQDFGIVRIRDCRNREYVQEVCKYAVKGSDLAGWPGEQTWEYICACKGRRLFFPFGTLRKQLAEIKKELRAAKGEGRVCECGSTKFLYQSEADVILDEIRAQRGIHRRRSQ
jgi:hypothetical protein